MLCVLMKILSPARAKTEGKKTSVFQISHFYWSVSSDIMAVKGLRLQPEPSGTSASQDYSQLGGDWNDWKLQRTDSRCPGMGREEGGG